MVSELWKRTFYTADITYIKSSFIREYDISKADISVFLSNGIITTEQYDTLARAPSLARNVQMGLLQQEHPEYVKILQSGILKAREDFFTANNVQDWEVLAVMNDAVFLINKVAKVTTFGNIRLNNKNTYNSFYRLPKTFGLEFYYYFNRFGDEEILEIKGMSDQAIQLHQGYMIEFLLVLFNTIETSPIAEALDIIQTFYNRYINRELELGYYRRLDSKSSFDSLLYTPITHSRYNIQYLCDNDKDHIDISYNASIIMEFYKVVSSMYFNKK